MDKNKLFILLTGLFLTATTVCHGNEHIGNAQDNKTWLPGCITTESTIYNLLDENPKPQKSGEKNMIEYDNYGRLLYDMPTPQYYAQYYVNEYDNIYTTIPHTTTWYVGNYYKKWVINYTFENEILKDDSGKTVRINKYYTSPTCERIFAGYQLFNYDEEGRLNCYTYVPAINTYREVKDKEGDDYYHKEVYTDLKWGQSLVDEPEIGSDAWREWLVSPKSGLKSYTYTDTLIDVKNYVETKMLRYKFYYTTDFGTDDYYWEECARLYGTNLQVTATRYTDDMGSHSEKVLTYSGVTDAQDRDENKLTYVYSQDTTYITPNKYTVVHTSHNIKNGNILESENSTYENTYNSVYGYLEKTYATGVEYTATEDKIKFEKTITYSDYRQYPTTSDIVGINNEAADDAIVSNLQGQRITSGTYRLPAGIYITKSGKKIVKK